MSNYIEKICENCQIKFETLFKYRNKARFCSQHCSRLFQVGENSPKYGKSYVNKKDNPEWAARISKTLRDNNVNVGDKNGMKKLEAREKASKTRKQMMKDPKVRKEISEKTKKAWEDGKFDGVAVGRCKWYSHQKPDGTIIKCQGRWELAFAIWMDSKDILYECHKGRIEYQDQDGTYRNYYPDFYVYGWEEFVDVKNSYHMKLQEQKFLCIKQSNKDKKIKILLKKDLLELGVVLDIKE